MNWSKAKAVLEAIIFASSEPVTLKEMSMTLQLNYETVEQILAELSKEYHDQQRGFKLKKWRRFPVCHQTGVRRLS